MFYNCNTKKWRQENHKKTARILKIDKSRKNQIQDLMKKRNKKNINNNFLKSSLLIIFSSFFIISPSSAQITSNKCELSGNLFYSDCTKYFGDCQDNKANGWGELYLNNNNTLKGLFVNNKLQNFYIEYYVAANNKLIIGPNRESALHGPCISISNEYVSFANYENGYWRGNSDLFQIPPPNYNFNGIFCDADGYGVKDNIQSNLIPNTTQVIYTSAREYNTRGDRKYWVSVVDLSSNKLIKKFGSYEKPLTINNAPLFIGFTKENKPIYNYSGKYFQFEIMSGIVNPLSKLPLEMISKNNQVETIKKTSYKDLGTISGWGLDKYKILKDSSYIKMFNSNIYLESLQNYKNERGSGSSLVMFNNKNEIIKSLDLPNYNIIDFDIDEQNERIALSYSGKDSICLSYYDLKTFKLISNVFRRIEGWPGKVKFSKTGTYLLYKLKSGTAIYLGNKLCYGIEGDLYDLNNDENVVISNSGDNVFAYDIEKKTIIWTHPIGENYINSKFFNVENKIYIISGRALSWEGHKVKENGIKLISFTMPKPLFSIKEFVKKPEETFVTVNITKDKKIENNNLTEKTKSQIKSIEKQVSSSSNQKINPNLKNEDCSVIVGEYEKFVSEFSKYCSGVKTGKRIPSPREYLNWDKNIRLMSDIVLNCLPGIYNKRIMTSMLRLQSSAKIIFSSSPQAEELERDNNSNNKCTFCKPSDSKGWYIQDYDEYKKEYTNGRYVKNIGHKPCSLCYGTGNCKAYNGCGNYSNKESNSCTSCKGDRWQECYMCKGTGESK